MHSPARFVQLLITHDTSGSLQTLSSIGFGANTGDEPAAIKRFGVLQPVGQGPDPSYTSGLWCTFACILPDLDA